MFEHTLHIMGTLGKNNWACKKKIRKVIPSSFFLPSLTFSLAISSSIAPQVCSLVRALKRLGTVRIVKWPILYYLLLTVVSLPKPSLHIVSQPSSLMGFFPLAKEPRAVERSWRFSLACFEDSLGKVKQAKRSKSQTSQSRQALRASQASQARQASQASQAT